MGNGSLHAAVASPRPCAGCGGLLPSGRVLFCGSCLRRLRGHRNPQGDQKIRAALDATQDLASDIDNVERFIFDELAVRVQSAEPEPNHDEENDIAEAKAARLSFDRIKQRLGL